MIDVHELANMPGAGKAKAALKKAGFWKEDYSFQDLCIALDEANVTIETEDGVTIQHDGIHEWSDIQQKLRKVMEA